MFRGEESHAVYFSGGSLTGWQGFEGGSFGNFYPVEVE
nr:MAG TPA: hypothetical protein [Caudoviricetes sp.]